MKSYIVKSFGKDTWQTSYSKIQEAVGTLQIIPSRERYLKSLRS